MAVYKGKLTVKQAVEGINAARRNARRLLEDAKLLFEVRRYLSIEEHGKAEILRAIAAAKDAAELKKRWKDFRTHQSKNILWMLPVLKAQGARTMLDCESIFDPNSDDPKKLDGIKKLGFYAECFGDARWWEPQGSVTKNMAQFSIAIIDYLVANEQEVSERELELWIEHFGGATYRPEHAYKFYRAMKSEGLFAESLEKVAAFLGLAPLAHAGGADGSS
jgi:AbiV family abortive infection protein